MGFIFYFTPNTIPPFLVTELNNYSSIEFSMSFIFIFRAESVYKGDLASYNQFTNSLNTASWEKELERLETSALVISGYQLSDLIILGIAVCIFHHKCH